MQHPGKRPVWVLRRGELRKFAVHGAADQGKAPVNVKVIQSNILYLYAVNISRLLHSARGTIRSGGMNQYDEYSNSFLSIHHKTAVSRVEFRQLLPVPMIVL